MVMKVFTVGKTNSDNGAFSYLHIFTGEKDNNGDLIVGKTVVYFDTRNEGMPVVYNRMFKHEEQDLDDWIHSIIWRVFSDQIELEGQWYINL
jgi:hypothetical protein